MAKLWDICDIHVINLYSRGDRYEHMIKELKRVGITSYEIHRFHKHPTNSALGLFENVINILSIGIHSKKPILIFEDDAIFIETSMPLLDCIYDYVQSPTYPWDTIRLGYNKAMYSQKINNNLYIGNAVTSTANIYSVEFANKLVNKYKGQVPKIHIDHQLAQLTGRNILPVRLITMQGHWGSDNEWPNKAAWKEYLKDPVSFQEDYNKIGWKWFHSYTFLPMQIKYYWLMCSYHKWYDVIGFKPKLCYEIKNVCNI